MGKYTATVSDRLVLPAQVFLTLGQERQLHQNGKAVPAGVPVRLAIDTGSGRTSLVPSILDRLKASTGDAVRMMTGLGSTLSILRWCTWSFPIPIYYPSRS